MSKVKILVLWYENGKPVELDDIISINITQGVDMKLNTADITLKNPISERGSDGSLYSKYVSSTSGLLRFKEGDSVKIYATSMEEERAIDTSITSADLIMSAEVQESNIKLEERSSKLKLSCVDKSFQLFNTLWSSTYLKDGALNTAPLIIQNIIRWAGHNSQQTKSGYDSSGNIVTPGLYVVDARLDTSSGYIETTRTDASSFPTVSIGRSFKPVYEWINDLSSIDYTNSSDDGTDWESNPIQDRNMIYYVDELNRFHWFYPKDSAITTLNANIADSGAVTTITILDTTSFESSGRIQIGAELFDYTGKNATQFTGCTRSVNNTLAEAHVIGNTVTSSIIIKQSDITTGNIWLSSDFTYKTFDIVNAVIFNSGDDMNGSGILGFWYDKTTDSPKLKMVYKAWIDIARKLKQDELNRGSQLSDTTITHVDGDEYDYPVNYTDYGAGKDLPSWSPGDSTITTDGTFNTSFRNEAERQGLNRAKGLTSRRGSARWRGKVKLQFKRFTAGTICTVTSSISGINNKDLRIQTVQYNLSKDSNTVTLDLEEDEKKKGEA